MVTNSTKRYEMVSNGKSGKEKFQISKVLLVIKGVSCRSVNIKK